MALLLLKLLQGHKIRFAIESGFFDEFLNQFRCVRDVDDLRNSIVKLVVLEDLAITFF